MEGGSRYLLTHGDEHPVWWTRARGCVALDGGLLRPRLVRAAFLAALADGDARLWVFGDATNGWRVPVDPLGWGRELETFEWEMPASEAEVLVCRDGFDPNGREGLRRALRELDAGEASGVHAWAAQPDTEPCAFGFLSREWAAVAERCLAPVVTRAMGRDYGELKSRALEHVIPYIVHDLAWRPE